MSTNAARHDTTITVSSVEATSTTAAGGTPSTQSTASTTALHHSNRYGSYSTHNQPIYNGPVYNIENAAFTGTPSPSLFPPPSMAASPLASPLPHATSPAFGPGTTSSVSSSSASAGRWVYVPEGEKQPTPQRPEKSMSEEVVEMDYSADVVETSRDFEEDLKLAFIGFLSKEHRPWKPPQQSGRRDDA